MRATSPNACSPPPARSPHRSSRLGPTCGEATAITTYEAITGFLIAAVAGVLIGIGLYVSKTPVSRYLSAARRRADHPAHHHRPAVHDLVPGSSRSAKIVIVAVFGVFPVAVQTCRGMLAVPQFYEGRGAHLRRHPRMGAVACEACASPPARCSAACVSAPPMCSAPR